MINVHNITLDFAGQKIFDALSFTCDAQDRIGLVGRNGSGKSTLLKVIAGQQDLTDGSVSIIKNKKLAYLPQEVVLFSDKSILDETCTAFEEINKLQQEQANLEALLETGDYDDNLLERYAHVCEELINVNANALEAEAKKVLLGLGFTQEQFDKPVATLSGGWKMRITLAKLLLQKADFYLLDEPTNHLDIVAQEWFLRFLRTSSFGFMIVCHDRYFLNQLCKSILELERGKGTFYNGNYSAYERQKEHNLHLLEAAYVVQQKEIKQKKETIEQMRAKASKAAMAQSMLKSLEKMELIELPPKQAEIHFNFPPVQQSGRVALTVHNLAQAFGPKKVFEHVSCEIERGMKIAIIAANGVGKTTLFNTIIGKLPAQHGTVTFGHNVHAAIFDQDQTQSLDMEKSILENLMESAPGTTEQRIRAFAGSFLLGKDAITKKVKVLSGGEKNRVGMIKVLLQNANLLLLDEPTNHLDIQSKDILLKALKSYQGTILFVSHDHDFVSNLATDILELTVDGVTMYNGDYDLYLYRKEQDLAKQQKVTIEPSTGKKTTKNEQQPKNDADEKTIKKQAVSLQQNIERLEQEMVRLEKSFATLSYGTPEYNKAAEKLQQCKKQHAQAVTEWEQVTMLL